jgi:biopolymer transport protein ExbD
MRRLFTKPKTISMLSIAALAPLIDIFTILVVAILKSSSASAPPQLPEPQTTLPLSAQEQSIQQPATIDIAIDGIYFNGARVTSRIYWEQQEAPIIEELYARMLLTPPSKIQIRADAKVPWKLIDKALATARQVGCSDIELLAVNTDSL